MKQAVIFSFSRQGGETAVRIADALVEEFQCQIYIPEKYSGGRLLPFPDRVGIVTGRIFAKTDLLVYVGACGIAVRSIAPYVKNKTMDPAVICVDECANFCISLLSGHIGGGNRWTKWVAEQIGAVPVVTTATDINHRFSVDEWAARQGYVIGSMKDAKDVSSAILEQDIPVYSDKPLPQKLPDGLCRKADGKIGIAVSVYKQTPFENTLNIIPKVLTLGIGCRKGMNCKTIEAAVQKTLEENLLDIRAVRNAASIDLKAGEKGLLTFCEKYRLPVNFYTAEQLLSVEGDFSSSGFVKSITGVDNVCERSAVCGGKRLIVNKTVYNGVTVAVAETDWEVHFEE